jgi:hypothetical protein
MAMSVISHPAIPPVTTVWSTVRRGWAAAGNAPAGAAGLPLAYDRKFSIKANAEGAKRAKPNKLLQIATTTLAVRRTKWTWFMTTSLAKWDDSVRKYEPLDPGPAIRHFTDTHAPRPGVN